MSQSVRDGVKFKETQITGNSSVIDSQRWKGKNKIKTSDISWNMFGSKVKEIKLEDVFGSSAWK